MQISSAASRTWSGGDDHPPIDLVHLSRQTMGDRQLETELLGLFATQAKAIVRALADPATGQGWERSAADLLHTLCGSARAVGSWTVAAEAEGIERDLRGEASAGTDPLPPARLATLGDSVARVCSAIDHLLEGERV